MNVIVATPMALQLEICRVPAVRNSKFNLFIELEREHAQVFVGIPLTTTYYFGRCACQRGLSLYPIVFSFI